MNRQDTFQSNLIVFILMILLGSSLHARATRAEFSMSEIDEYMQDMMEQGDIPGISLVMIDGDRTVMRGYGYADGEEYNKVTPETLFEIGSCSKSFTALAILQLEREGLLDLDEPVSKYLSWFFVTYNGTHSDITVNHLLHHTSGIPWQTISTIPEGTQVNALEQTVRNIVGIELTTIPGKHFEYATINYDILGAVIEEVSGKPFEEYMMRHLFVPLGLADTTVGMPKSRIPMATGYKIGFFAPRKYEAPRYRGNNPAGYVISNGKDMAQWLKFQMGLLNTEFASLIRKSHIPDRTVPPHADNLSSYAMGWQIYQEGHGKISHGGLNPNFTAYIGLRPEEKIGVAVLANSNSSYTGAIGEYILGVLLGESPEKIYPSGDSVDTTASVLSGLLGVYLLSVTAFLVSIIVDIIKGVRQFETCTLRKFLRFLISLLLCGPFLVGVYMIPYIIANISWKTAIVWSPISLPVAVGLFLLSVGVSYLAYGISLLFPQNNNAYGARFMGVEYD